MMTCNWLSIANKLNTKGEKFVIVSVLGLRGSAPVTVGQKFIVTQNDFYLTLGGGRLEQEAINNARECLVKNQTPDNLSSLSLGAKLGQCCGGKVILHYDIYNLSNIEINIFGCGHVAQELVRILMRLPHQINCIDVRSEWLNKLPKENNIKQFLVEDYCEVIADLNKNSYNLIMTHRHDLDLNITIELLKINAYPLVGIIGSQSKATRFKQQLKNRQLPLDAFLCPIGESANKDPVSVAIMIAAKLCKEITIENEDPKISKEANRLLAELANQNIS